MQRARSVRAMVSHPHYLARETLIEWELEDGTMFKSAGAVPKTTKTSIQIWRPTPKFGMDNEDILAELGYSPEQIQELYDKKVTAQDPTVQGAK